MSRSLARRVVVSLPWLAGCAADVPSVSPDSLRAPDARLAPQWVVNGLSDVHPDQAFLQAVGVAEIGASIADARERAEFKARAALVRNLSSHVRAEVESHELFQADDQRSRLQVSLEQTIAVVGEGVLEGARPVDFFVDAAAAHCLLVLERAPAAAELRRRIDEKEADAAALLGRSQTSAPSAALLALCEAYDHVLAARVLMVSYAVLARAPLTGRDSVGDNVLAALHAQSSPLQLDVVAGQGQTARVGKGLLLPIVLRLRGSDGRGVDGVSLRCTSRGDAKAELSAPLISTADGGSATLAVRAVGAARARSNQIECSIDALARRDLSGPIATVEYLLPTVASTRVLVMASAAANGDPVDSAASAAGARAALASAGFAAVPPALAHGKLGPDDSAPRSAADLCKALRGEVEYVVRIAAAAQAAQGRQDRMRARATALIEIVDVDSGEVEQVVSDPVDGLGDSHAQAAAAAIERLGTAVGSKAVARLRARLGLP